jgi:hypothetical protein
MPLDISQVAVYLAGVVCMGRRGTERAMIITYTGWDEVSGDGKRIGEETISKEIFGHDALTALGAIRQYVNLELVSIQRSDRECIACHTDLSGVMGVYVFVDGKCAPDRTTRGGPDIPQVLLCVQDGANGANNLSQARYDALMSFYT